MGKDILLPVDIAGIHFKNPFFVASGPTTKSVAQLRRIEEAGWAAASIKLTIDPFPYVNRKPRYAVFKDRNALCFTTEKRLKTDEGLRLMDNAKKKLKELILMANITYAGDDGVEGWVRLAKEFENVGADIIELNMCCPNMSFNLELTMGSEHVSKARTGASLGQQGGAVAEIVRAIKKEVKIPLFVKLTPEGGKVGQIAKEVYEAGADAVGGTSNRMAMPPINLDDPSKSPFHLTEEISMACHCGHYLLPLALRDTYEMRNIAGPDMRIMQAGGIVNWEDAVDMIMCGADLVGVSSETLIRGFDYIHELKEGVKNYLDAHGYKNLSEIRDAVVPHVKTAATVTVYDGYAKIKDNKLAGPCKAASPTLTPAQSVVRYVADRKFKEAYSTLVKSGPLKEVTAFVGEEAAEKACTRGITGKPVRIGEVYRFLFEKARKEKLDVAIKREADCGKRAAVIGAGAAGLSAAYELRLLGYDVTVFEREEKAGGILRYGIPAFRLDKGAIDREVARLEGLGIKFEYGKAVSEPELDASYDYVVTATGFDGVTPLAVPGGETAVSVLDYLKSVNTGAAEKECGAVVVIGNYGALDAARSALRLGASKVYIVGGDGMADSERDISLGLDEGVVILANTEAVEVTAEGVVAANRDAADAKFTLAAAKVINATGLEGGVNTANGVESAILLGKKLAHAVDSSVALPVQPNVVDPYKVIERNGFIRDEGYLDLVKVPAAKRVKSFDLPSRTMTEEEAVAESGRCLRCGCGDGCSICKDLCAEFAIYNPGTDCMTINEKACVACGMCYNLCPNGNIEMINRGVSV